MAPGGCSLTHAALLPAQPRTLSTLHSRPLFMPYPPTAAPAAGADQATLRLAQLPAGAAIDHGTGYGRVAYSCPTGELRLLQVMPWGGRWGRVAAVCGVCAAKGSVT